MFHSVYELENLSRQVPEERLREAENARLVALARHNPQRSRAEARGLGRRLFNRRMSPLDSSRG